MALGRTYKPKSARQSTGHTSLDIGLRKGASDGKILTLTEEASSKKLPELIAQAYKTDPKGESYLFCACARIEIKTMPTLSLKRRHKRQLDLSTMQNDLVYHHHALPSGQARIVSDEDIQQQPSRSDSQSSLSTDVIGLPLDADSDDECSMHANKRRKHSVDSSDFWSLDSYCVSPPSRDRPTTATFIRSKQATVTPTSPWGHFVDLTVPESPSGDSSAVPFTFVPSCPAVSPCDEDSPGRRQVDTGSTSTASTRNRKFAFNFDTDRRDDLEGFILQVPTSAGKLSSDSTPTAAEAYQLQNKLREMRL